ncbi:Tyramine receptor tyra-2 [Toxocara canis]|uniref:Tyramine receptor tyra-2 n=1 Tax=Toxocara canis TaxID=6265 RepID=A0A0B2VFS6_TOXCA|nr:Tyramine receptor tyra-2 [Toxocara canis]
MHGVAESNLELFQTFKGAALTLLVLWTIAANSLVFIVLYKNPRLQTVPNLLVGNLAFSDLCLGLIVLPLSSVYAIAGEWLFTSTLCVVFVSADILCSTASIWNLSIVGLDRYWAITSPVSYMSKRNKRTAGLMILSVWISSALISLAPLLGWKQTAERGNMVQVNGTWQCVFLDLPSYTIYSATGSFFIPTIVMFFVYFKIYQAFAKHRARQIYRQKIRLSVILRAFLNKTATSGERLDGDNVSNECCRRSDYLSYYEHSSTKRPLAVNASMEIM